MHQLGSITTEEVYLELTFITLAMLVVGGMTSLWGAVVGALAISGLDSFLSQAEEGVHVGFTLDLPQGSRLVFLAAIMALVLILRPSGLTGGREFRLPALVEAAPMRVCVVGCGAVGSLFAANLALLDDVEVWAYDLAQDHVDAINASGLRLSGAGDVVGHPRATSDAAELPPCELGIVATKSMHTEPAIAATAHAFAEGSVCSVQNGIGNEEVIARHVDRVIRGTTFPAGQGARAGTCPVGREGRHDDRALRAEPGADGGRRAARRRVHAGGAADEGGRRRARPAVAQGDLQRRHEPGRSAHGPHARTRLRGPGPAARWSPASSTRARRSPPRRGSSSTPTRRT